MAEVTKMKNQKGFSLSDVLIMASIFGIVATIVVPYWMS
jgi:type II secretory pathway pseudopilin PulG